MYHIGMYLKTEKTNRKIVVNYNVFWISFKTLGIYFQWITQNITISVSYLFNPIGYLLNSILKSSFQFKTQ